MQANTESYDVVVVGYGAAGAAAALEAARGGASVLIVERFHGGGTTAISGGVFYAGGGTKYQQDAGVEDSPDNMYNYLHAELGDDVSETLLRDFCNESIEQLTWLESLGVPFDSKVCPFKTSMPTEGYSLYYSGSENVRPFSDVASPAQRGHRAVGKGRSGDVVFSYLDKAVQAAGIKVVPYARVTDLIFEGDRVVGVRYSQVARYQDRYTALATKLTAAAGKLNLYAPFLGRGIAKVMAAQERTLTRPVSVRARRGVILAAGGYAYNRQLVEQHAPRFKQGRANATMGDDGSGIALARSAGASVSHLDKVSGWRLMAPPDAMQKGVLVAADGDRVCCEQLYGARVGMHVAHRANGKAWLILDQAIVAEMREQIPNQTMWWQRASLEAVLAPTGHVSADSIAELGRKCGIDSFELNRTIADYNDRIAAGTEDEMLKADSYRQPIANGPFIALDFGIKNQRMPFVLVSLGGVDVDEHSRQAVRNDGTPIEGLYAVGRTAVGVCTGQYVSGLSLSDCIFTGRRAGRHVVASAAAVA